MKIYNPNIKNINRIEFSVTNCCTSRCKHCSVGEIKGTDNISVEPAIEVIELLTKEYKVESVMTFGGEPLLFAETTCTIHKKATECGIPIRQIITNGCFTKDELRMQHVAKALNECGVNEILLSIDCFHEEFLPLTWVHTFAEKLVDNYRGRLKLHPAWVVNETHDNPYNQRTRHCLKFFDDLQIDIDEGNNVFPSGNAVKYLNEYFVKQPIDLAFKCGQAPYTSELDKVEGISVNPNGDVVICSFPIGNINEKNILEILNGYNPMNNPYTSALLENGIAGLIAYAENIGIEINPDEYYSPCGICRSIAQKSWNS